MKNVLGAPKSNDTARPNVAPAADDDVATGGFDIGDLKQYLHIVVKRIWLVTLCFVIAIASALIYLLNQQPVYRSTCKIQITSGLPMPGSFNAESMQMLSKDTDYFAVQQNILQSRTIVARAQERLGRPLEEIQEKVRNVGVHPNRRIGQIHVAIDCLDPLLGSDFANAMAEEYLEFKAEQRLDTSQSTVISLTQQANRIRDELQREEEKLFAYERENIGFAGGVNNSASDFLSKLQKQETDYRLQRLMLEAQQPYLAEAGDDVILSALSSPLASSGGGFLGTNAVSAIAQAGGPEALVSRGVVENTGDWKLEKRKRQRILAELTDARTKFRPAHPEIRSLEQKLKEVEQKLEVELQFVLQNYYAKLEALIIKENASRLAASEWENEALKANRKKNDYMILKNNVDRVRSLYKTVLTRLKEIDISIGFEPENITVLERAAPSSSPITTRRAQNIFLAALIGIGIGVALVFGLEYIDDSIRYPDEVKTVLKIPFFGVIPSANWDPDDLNSHMLSNIDQRSGLAEAYRNVRSALIFSGLAKHGTSLAFTSAVPKEGKTTTTLNMSVSLAQAGYRVLLVDADMRRGELHKFFGLEGGRGFADVLAGNAKPESLIQRTGIQNLDLIATGPFPSNPAELLLRNEFKGFLEYTRRTYDLTLFDCPPVMAVSEAGIMASLADNVIFVVWVGQTSRKLSGMSVQALRERGANLVGCVLNNLEFGRVGYYYYSTYYGYYDYDYRYEASNAS